MTTPTGDALKARVSNEPIAYVCEADIRLLANQPDGTDMSIAPRPFPEYGMEFPLYAAHNVRGLQPVAYQQRDWRRGEWSHWYPSDEYAYEKQKLTANSRYEVRALYPVQTEAPPVEQAPQPVAYDGPLTVSYAVHQIAHNLLLAHTGQEGGCPKIDWYRLRSEISDAITVALDDQRKRGSA